MDEIKISLDEFNPIGCEEIPQPEVKIPNKLEVYMEQKGVESLIKAIKYIGTVGKAIKTSLEGDNKITITDAVNFMPVLIATPGFISAIVDVPAELADTITEDEKMQIISAIKETALIPENVEEAVDTAIKIVFDIKNFVFQYLVKKEG